MANYPTLPLDDSAGIKPVDLGRRDLTGAGVRVRYLAAIELYELALSHSYLTRAEAESVYTLWAADPGATVTYAYKDGYAYDCKWDGPPEVDFDHGVQRWWAKSKLIGTRNP